MIIRIRSHAYGPYPSTQNRLGYDVVYSWLGAHERAVLNGIDIQYVFRGFAGYRFSGPKGGGNPDNYIEYVLGIDEADFDLITIACGRVEMLHLDRDPMTQIMVLKDRKMIGLNDMAPEEWEARLSNPPKIPTLIAARSSRADLNEDAFR